MVWSDWCFPFKDSRLMAIRELVLARLLAAGEKGELGSKVRKDLEPLLSHRWSGAELAGRLDRALDALESAGLAVSQPGKTKRAAPRIVLTAEGRQRALDALGVAELRPKTTWVSLRKTYLPAMALGLPAASEAAFKAMASDPVFRAVLLKRQYSLPTAEVPKLDVAIDALAWKLIGFEGVTGKFDLKRVKTALLNRELGDGRAADFKKAANRLVAHRAGARRDDAKELRDAVLRDWIGRDVQEEIAAQTSAPEAPPAQSEAPRSLDPSVLVERVKATARDCPTGRFGDHKVFIAHVWDRLQSEPDFAGMDLDGFKRALAEANNLRLIDLARADLVQAMDPEDVRRSEVHYLNTTFHFVRI
jgi:hypothetical protein